MFSAVLVAAAAVLSADVSVMSKVVQVKGVPHVLNEPEYVTDGVIMSQWSADGTKLIAQAIRPRPTLLQPKTEDSKTVLTFWSATTRKVTGEYTLPPSPDSQAEVMWEGSSSVVVNVFSQDEGVQSIVRVQPNGKWSEIRLEKPRTGYRMIQTSPTQRGILVLSSSFGREESFKAELAFIPPDRNEAIPVAMPPDMQPIYAMGFEVSGFTKDRKRHTFIFDPVSVSLRPGTSTPEEPETGELAAVRGNGLAASLGEPRRQAAFESWWLMGDPEAKFPAALLAPKASNADVTLATLNASYIDSGNLFVRRLVKITQDEVDDLLECEEKMTLLSDTKQVGTGIMIFMADNDDDFPPATGWRDKVFPYIKNDKILDGFVYSYKGPRNAVDVENPATTELGYKDGQFGRAVVRADSSAIWESRRKRPGKLGC